MESGGLRCERSGIRPRGLILRNHRMHPGVVIVSLAYPGSSSHLSRASLQDSRHGCPSVAHSKSRWRDVR